MRSAAAVGRRLRFDARRFRGGRQAFRGPDDDAARRPRNDEAALERRDGGRREPRAVGCRARRAVRPHRELGRATLDRLSGERLRRLDSVGVLLRLRHAPGRPRPLPRRRGKARHRDQHLARPERAHGVAAGIQRTPFTCAARPPMRRRGSSGSRTPGSTTRSSCTAARPRRISRRYARCCRSGRRWRKGCSRTRWTRFLPAQERREGTQACQRSRTLCDGRRGDWKPPVSATPGWRPTSSGRRRSASTAPRSTPRSAIRRPRRSRAGLMRSASGG